MALDPSLLSGAINGTGDTSQSIFRRRAPAPAAIPTPQGIASPAPAAVGQSGGADYVGGLGAGEGLAADPSNAVNAQQLQAAKVARTGGNTNFDPSNVPAPTSILAGTGPAPVAPFDLNNPGGPGITGNGPIPSPIGRAANLVSAAAPTVSGGITTLPPMTVTAPQRLADVGATPAQAGFLARNGVPIDQQTATAIGGDGSGDNAATERRAAIRAGTAPGQNVRLGYDGTSRIYGTSSQPGGPINTFTGIGTADPNNPTTRIDGASAVAAQKVGLGISPTQQAASDQVRASAANGGITSVDAQLNNARSVADGTTRDLNSNLSRANDPFDPIGRQLSSLRAQLSRQGTRSGREAINSQINTIMTSLAGNGAAGATARNGVENAGVNSITSLTNTGMTQAGDTQRANIQQAGETQRLGMQQNAPTPEVTSDGGYRMRTGSVVTPITSIDGKAADAPLGASLTEGGRALQGFSNQIGQAIASGQMTPEQGNEALVQARMALTAPRPQGIAGTTPAPAAQKTGRPTIVGPGGKRLQLSADGTKWEPVNAAASNP